MKSAERMPFDTIHKQTLLRKITFFPVVIKRVT